MGLLNDPTLRPSIIIQGALTTSTGVVLVVLVLDFVVPGVAFRISMNSRTCRLSQIARISRKSRMSRISTFSTAINF